MRHDGLRNKTVKQWRATTHSSHRLPSVASTLDRQFTVAQPKQVRTGDITYVWPLEGWLYLYSRAVVGWAIDLLLTGDLTEQALRMALTTRQPHAGLLHHSDRGSQHAGWPCQQMLTAHDITGSMSCKANCWDNACLESFFDTFKREPEYHQDYAMRDEAKQDSFEHIEVFYNWTRRHSTIGYHSPAEYKARAVVG